MTDAPARPEEPPAQQPGSERSEKRTALSTAALSAVAALLGALIGGGFTVYASNQGIQSQERLRVAEVQQQNDERLRSLRVDAYRGFLESIYAMRGRFNDFLGCEEPLETRCPSQFRAYYLSQNDMEIAYNVLLIYSSKSGASLTAKVHDKSKEVFSDEMVTGTSRSLLDEIGEWDDLMVEFRRQWCRDLNFEPEAC